MKTLIESTLRSFAISTAVLISAAVSHAQSPLIAYDFTLGMSPAQNVDTAQALGFSGLVTRVKDPADVIKLANYESAVATIDDFTMLAYVNYDFLSPASPNVWLDMLPILVSLDAPLWIIIKNSPSELATRAQLEEMAEAAAVVGVRAIVYPHWNTSIETAAEAAALIDEIGHSNLKNSFHTYHEIRGGNQYDMRAVVYEHAGDFALVGIAGADENAYAGPPMLFVTWDDIIQPLDESEYDLRPILRALRDTRYDGPVILQTFGLPEDTGHLERSIRKYAQWQTQVDAATSR